MTAMRSSLHWVRGIEPHRLALSPRPPGGEPLAAELAAWQRQGVDVVVSLLEPPEAQALDLQHEATLCRAVGMGFHSFPIRDHGVPTSAAALSALLDLLQADLRQGRAVAIHCFAGIGRTGVVAACLLHRLQVPPAEALHLLSRSRGLAMPETLAQLAWFERFASPSPPVAG